LRQSQTKGRGNKKSKARLPKAISAALAVLYFPLTLLFQEIVFHKVVFGSLSIKVTVMLVLYSLFLGTLLSLPGVLLSKTKAGKIITGLLLFVCGLCFTVEYFIDYEFQTIFDLKTMFVGAGGVFSDFLKSILSMVFSAAGLWHILLFFLPLLLYVLFLRRVLSLELLHLRAKSRLTAIILMALICVESFAGARVFIQSDSAFQRIYGRNYSFHSATEDFGLMAGLRMDLVRVMTPDDTDFEFAETSTARTVETSSEVSDSHSTSQEELSEEELLPAETSWEETSQQETSQETSHEAGDSGETSGETSESSESSESSEPEEPEEIVYGKNELDIDFEALAESAPTDELAALDRYVASLTSTSKNEYTGLFKGKNLIFICAEAFSAPVVDEERTPTLYRMATKGINFTDYSQPYSASTTGGECELLLGVMPVDGANSMLEIVGHNNYYTIASFLDREGYFGQAYHNHRYTYYSRNITHEWLGYSDGFIGNGNGLEDYLTVTWPESDVEMFEATIPWYIDKEHFNIYYMTVSGHSEYNTEDNEQAYRHWDEVKDLEYSTAVKCYLACQMELEDSVTILLEALEEKGIADDTVVVISGDHFPYGLSEYQQLGDKTDLNELYGYNVKTRMDRDQNKLIIWSGCLEDEEPIVVDSPVTSIDVLPTLLNLFGCEFDSRLLPGRDVFSSEREPLVYTVSSDFKSPLGEFVNATDVFTPYDPDMENQAEYTKQTLSTISNRLKYSKLMLTTDYFTHVFGLEEANEG